jgi:signal transduction histidine kinase
MAHRPAHVLIADDSPDNRHLLTSLLVPDGHTILEAEDGVQALALAPQADLVVLDIRMPGLDGLEVCRRLRQSARTRFLPIILVTALDDREARLAGIEAGADDFLTKPIDQSQLIARVRALLRLKWQRDDAEKQAADFAAMIVHDLRSPLASVIGFAELLAGDLPITEREEFTGHITRNARAMLQLINDLLDLNRLASESAPRHVATIRPRQLLQDAMGQMAPLAHGRHLQLDMAAPADLPTLRGDARQLSQILVNLLDNAVKFARHVARLTARVSGDYLELIIDDDGPGVPEAEWPRLFERWHQAEAGHRHAQGYGLGLAIAKRLVELHAGTIQAGRSPEGGLRLTVRLPVGSTG